MDILPLLLGWLLIVVGSMAAIVYLAHRWGHDPFGWSMLAAAMGPIAIVALVGTRGSDVERRAAHPPTRQAAPAARRIIAAVDCEETG